MLIRFTKKTLLFLALALSMTFGLPVVASAHVTVKPGEVLTSSFENFTIGAPNEREVGYTAITLEIPSGLAHVSPNVKAGWTVEAETDGTGEDAVIKSLTWYGGIVPKGFREDFGFSAQVPAKVGELHWKAVQTYEDGTVVNWNLKENEQPKKADGSPDFSKSGPFSITKVTKQTAETESINAVKSANDATARQADRALYLGLAGLLLGLWALLVATRRSQSK